MQKTDVQNTYARPSDCDWYDNEAHILHECETAAVVIVPDQGGVICSHVEREGLPTNGTDREKMFHNTIVVDSPIVQASVRSSIRTEKASSL